MLIYSDRNKMSSCSAELFFNFVVQDGEGIYNELLYRLKDSDYIVISHFGDLPCKIDGDHYHVLFKGPPKTKAGKPYDYPSDFPIVRYFKRRAVPNIIERCESVKRTVSHMLIEPRKLLDNTASLQYLLDANPPPEMTKEDLLISNADDVHLARMKTLLKMYKESNSISPRKFQTYYEFVFNNGPAPHVDTEQMEEDAMPGNIFGKYTVGGGDILSPGGIILRRARRSTKLKRVKKAKKVKVPDIREWMTHENYLKHIGGPFSRHRSVSDVLEANRGDLVHRIRGKEDLPPKLCSEWGGVDPMAD